jgi:anti-sigma regulatory factor (Ser/Thr protein kinase)
LSLRPRPDEVRVAREFCLEQLCALVADSPRLPDLLDDAAMITSELVTNSIRAGATSIRLSLHHTAGSVRIVVTDDAAGVVAVGSPKPLDTNGRGLQIVATLAAGWGVDTASTGKSVWAELDLPMADQRACDADADLPDIAAS